MKKVGCVLVLALLPAAAAAQQDSTQMKEAEVGEVVVHGKRVIRHNDRDVYLPGELQRSHAANGLDLLDLVKLPRIHVDQVEKTISSLSAGEVQLRINGVISTADELQAVRPDKVVRIEYITNPGVKYGAGLAAVINIKTRRDDKGTAVGINAMNAVTTSYNDNNGWATIMSGRSELGVRYGFKLNSNGDVRTGSTQRFAGTDGTMKLVDKHGCYDNSRYSSHDVTLSYNYADTLDRVFDVKLSMNHNGFPDRTLTESVTDGQEHYKLSTLNTDRENSPMLRLYYSGAAGTGNSFSAYVAAAYVDSRYGRGFTMPGDSDRYDVDGDKYSIRGELAFSHSFGKAGDLNLGYHQTGSYTRNIYVSGSEYVSAMHNDSQYLFADYEVSAGQLYVSVGVGGSREYFSSGDGRYSFWMFRPNFSLRYGFSEKFSASYDYDSEPSLPTTPTPA